MTSEMALSRNTASEQERTEGIILQGLGDGLLAATKRVAAVVVGVLGIIHGGIGGITRGVLGLTVQILHRACRFTRTAGGLGLRVTGHVADGTFDLTREILCRAPNPILFHP